MVVVVLYIIATCNKRQLLCRLLGNVLRWFVMSFCSAEVLPQGLGLAAVLKPAQILAWQVYVYTGMHCLWINAVAEVIHPSCLLCPRNTETKTVCHENEEGGLTLNAFRVLKKGLCENKQQHLWIGNISQSESVWQVINYKAYDITGSCPHEHVVVCVDTQ